MSLPHVWGEDCDGRTPPAFARKLVINLIGISLIASCILSLIAGLGLGAKETLFLTDYEESVEWQMVRDREYPNLKLWMSDVGYGRSVDARYFDCVSPKSPHFETLKISRGHQGLAVDTSCEPLDFSHLSADKLHPDLVVQPYFVRRDYIASLPGFSPKGERAVMLRTKWNEYVLIHYDILVHLDMLDTEGNP